MLPLHILSFGCVIGVSAIADKDALGWMRGTQPVLEAKRLRQYHLLIWIGLASVVVSGILLLYPARLYLLGDILFDIKLLFVAILFVNAVLIGRLVEYATTIPFREVSLRDKRALFMSGAISLMSWAAAAAIAFAMFG
jgi:hypothetical protein